MQQINATVQQWVMGLDWWAELNGGVRNMTEHDTVWQEKKNNGPLYK